MNESGDFHQKINHQQRLELEQTQWPKVTLADLQFCQFIVSQENFPRQFWFLCLRSIFVICFQVWQNSAVIMIGSSIHKLGGKMVLCLHRASRFSGIGFLLGCGSSYHPIRLSYCEARLWKKSLPDALTLRLIFHLFYPLRPRASCGS